MPRFMIAVFILSFLSIGCTMQCQKSHSEMTAEDVVQSYLEIVFNMEDLSQRTELMELTTDELKQALAQATDATIKAAYIDHRYHLKRFSLVERRDKTPRETDITYQIVYIEKDKDDKNFKDAPQVETENTVAMIKEKGRWYIREVLGSKTSIEFGLSHLNRIKAESP